MPWATVQGRCRTDCDVLVTDALVANQNLPSPDPTLTDLLGTAYSVAGDAGHRCLTTAGDGRPEGAVGGGADHGAPGPDQGPGPVRRGDDGVKGSGEGIVGPVPEGRDPDVYDRLRRRVLWSLPLGLYVLGSRAGSRRNLMTVSWVTQVAQEPKSVGVGVEREALTHELLVEGGVFALSLLARRDRNLVRRFVKPVREVEIDEDGGTGTMNGVPVRVATTGAPILEVATAWLECEVRHQLRLGSHTWFVGEVVDVGVADRLRPRLRRRRRGGPDEGAGVLRMEDTRMNTGVSAATANLRPCMSGRRLAVPRSGCRSNPGERLPGIVSSPGSSVSTPPGRATAGPRPPTRWPRVSQDTS